MLPWFAVGCPGYVRSDDRTAEYPIQRKCCNCDSSFLAVMANFQKCAQLPGGEFLSSPQMIVNRDGGNPSVKARLLRTVLVLLGVRGFFALVPLTSAG